ncbi:hypothetical protein BpHYR1_052063 [Brachionus plicatilis]|uniref:Uncharacterized protein n=1 Tax=Brachionus plicatilis TaxID=10195 RepID=A0A3M7Q3C5_BRAPC|nr:hypothetical protein BpHYR1_052063 [Brachionus plicatilis]
MNMFYIKTTYVARIVNFKCKLNKNSSLFDNCGFILYFSFLETANSGDVLKLKIIKGAKKCVALCCINSKSYQNIYLERQKNFFCLHRIKLREPWKQQKQRRINAKIVNDCQKC